VSYQKIISCLKSLSDKEIALHSQQYFKTGKGEYGHGDKFLGIRVPVLRKTVVLFQDTALPDIKKLLKSEYHEARLFSLLLLLHQFSNGDDETKQRIYHLYLKHTCFINNWDLVDTSAPGIVGNWLFDKDRSVLYQLAQSQQLWERRIAIIATACFIRNGQFHDTLKLSKKLINDPEDLIHKAVGWMLREVGKRDRAAEIKYLNNNYKKMPRTMLRYAIEKFDEGLRKAYLKGEV
jgi:3-methyladenine DNA glycosylase AlkD